MFLLTICYTNVRDKVSSFCLMKVADEFFESIEGMVNKKTAFIVSYHNFENTPSVEEIGDLAARIQATGADIVKIATTAVDITDNARILQVLTYSQVHIITQRIYLYIYAFLLSSFIL